MKKIYSFLVCMLLLATLSVQAQTYTQTVQEENMASFTSQNSQLNYLSGQNNRTATNDTPTYNGNNIFISQTGDGNVVSSNTKSETSDIRITQNGNNNNTGLNIEARTIRESVLQDGNNNSFTDRNAGTVNFHSGEIIQRGDNHNVEWYGGNSISEKLKVSQQGNGYGKTILVRSFN